MKIAKEFKKINELAKKKNQVLPFWLMILAIVSFLIFVFVILVFSFMPSALAFVLSGEDIYLILNGLVYIQAIAAFSSGAICFYKNRPA